MKSLLHQLAFGIWMFRPEAVEAYMPRVYDVLTGAAPIARDARKDADLMARAAERLEKLDAAVTHALPLVKSYAHTQGDNAD